MVFSEAMRLFPPSWIINRKALRNCVIENYTIPAKSMVIISQYVTHRDPRFYPDPLRFDPERWTPEARSARPEFSYFPFGGGPRLCTGESFAWIEGLLIIATLAQKWKMRLVPGHPVEPKPVLTLRPKYGMKMILEHRR